MLIYVYIYIVFIICVYIYILYLWLMEGQPEILEVLLCPIKVTFQKHPTYRLLKG